MSRTVTVALVAVLFALVSAGVPVGATGSGAQSGGIDHQINFTVAGSGGGANHQPGASGVDRYLYQEDLGVDFEVLDFVTFVSPANSESDCTTTDARAAGIDRGNDDPGTYTDETLVGKYSERVNSTNSRGQSITSIDFYGKDSFAGEHVSLYKVDQGVLALEDCFTNPEEPGWYRGYAYFNGTGPDGNRKQIAGFSNWAYICDCESYDAAVNKLGEPPAEGPQGDTMPGRGDGPWYLAETGSSSSGGSGDSGGSSSGQTATATSGSTATATSGSGGGGSTVTSGSGGSTATATTVSSGSSTDTADQRRGRSAGTADGTPATSAGTGTAASTNVGSGSATTVTASSTHQPGLGVAAALAALALALAALVARRR